MRAIVFHLSIPKYLAAKALGKRIPALHYGKASCLRFDELPAPVLRGPSWTRLKVERAGVCGTDMATIFFKLAPSLSPFSSFPCVLGHEVQGRLAQVGTEARAEGFKEGDRVVVNPFIGCRVRDQPLCPACARGDLCTCHRGGDTDALSPGACIGYHRDLPGGWSEHMLAHHSQLFHVPEGMDSDRAVLIEPLAIGVHAVLRRLPRDGEKVLVIGGGMIAFAVLAALSALGVKAHVTSLSLLEYQADLARRLGATETLRPQKSVSILDEVCRITGAKRHKPVLGSDVLTGGFDLTFDCVGAKESVRDALSFTTSQGTVVMVGAAGELPKIDLTPIWSRELSILGTVGYAPEIHPSHHPSQTGPTGARRHTFDLTRELFTGPAGDPVDALVTHRFPLERYRDAIIANVDRAGTRSVKTIFTP